MSLSLEKNDNYSKGNQEMTPKMNQRRLRVITSEGALEKSPT